MRLLIPTPIPIPTAAPTCSVKVFFVPVIIPSGRRHPIIAPPRALPIIPRVLFHLPPRHAVSSLFVEIALRVIFVEDGLYRGTANGHGCWWLVGARLIAANIAI